MRRTRRSVRALEPLREPHNMGCTRPLRQIVPPPSHKKAGTLLSQSFALEERVPTDTGKQQQLMKQGDSFAAEMLVAHPQITCALEDIINHNRHRAAMQTAERFELFRSHQVSPSKNFVDTLKPKPVQLSQERQEVVDLARWLDSKLETVRKKEKLSLSDVLEYKQSVVNLGLGQLLTLIERNCKEEARLMKVLWDSTFNIFEGLLRVLTKHCQDQEGQHLRQVAQQAQLYQRLLAVEKQKNEEARTINRSITERLKQLIGNHRLLKRQKKRLSLQHRMVQCSLQSYQESYQVLLEVALQSSNDNIVKWARQLMRKLLKDKRRKKKNCFRIEADKQIIQISTRVVLQWLRRSDQPISQIGLDGIDQDQQPQKRDEEVRRSRTRRSNLKKVVNVQDCQTSATQLAEVQLSTSLLHLEQSGSEQDKENIYEYFKCYDIGTQAEPERCQMGVATDIVTNSVCSQTQSTSTAEMATLITFTPNQPTDGQIRTNNADLNVQRDGLTSCHKDISIYLSQMTLNSRSDSLTHSSNQEEQGLMAEFQEDQSFSGQLEKMWKQAAEPNPPRGTTQPRKRNAVIGSPKRVNFVRVRPSVIPGPDERRRMGILGTTICLAGVLEKPCPMPRKLKLQKFSDIFSSEKQRMLSNVPQYMRGIEQNRSFNCFPQNSQSIYQRDETINRTKIFCQGRYLLIEADYSLASKFVRNSCQQNINVIKHRFFKQNQQMLSSLQSEIKPMRIREQKVRSVYNTLCKILSHLVVDYVRLVKKESEEVPSRTEKFFYPLGVLYVDRLLHYYGLREIAEKNMRSNLNHIASLSIRYEKVLLFRELLEADSSGDELELYVRCLVYLDTSGKVGTNQASLKQFNIDRLETDMDTVRLQLPTVAQFLNLQPTELSNILQKLQIRAKQHQTPITIEDVALLLIAVGSSRMKRLARQYLPQYTLITNTHSSDPVSSYMRLLQQCRISYENETEVVRLLASNLDVLENGTRTISRQRFLSLCINYRFPTVSQMTQHFWNQLQRFAMESQTKTQLIGGIDLPTVMQLAEKWKCSVPRALLAELSNSMQANGLELIGINRFWWGMLLLIVFNSHLQSTITKYIPELALINATTYGLRFAKPT